MTERKKLLPVIFLFISLSFVCMAVSATNVFGIPGMIGTLFIPLEKAFFHSSLVKLGPEQEIDTLRSKNRDLELALSEMKKLQDDNNAFRDQFEQSDMSPRTLIAASVVGAPGFVPGTSVPEYLVIDRGTTQGLRKGLAVVYKNALIGQISELQSTYAKVDLISKKGSTITVKDQQTDALGIVRGQGDGSFIIDNVILSEKLAVGDSIITYGDIDASGSGLPPGLVLGKITSVEKSQSALFQKASIESPLDQTQLSEVFVLIQK